VARQISYLNFKIIKIEIFSLAIDTMLIFLLKKITIYKITSMRFTVPLILLLATVDAFWSTAVQPRRHVPTRLQAATQTCRARDLIQSLVDDEKCFVTETGAKAFGEVCAMNIVYEDRFEPQPVVGRSAVTSHLLRKAEMRGANANFRIDKISDGNRACGFAWTWTCGNQEGLRGTTFIELNDNGEIQYVQEIPEPIFKPGDLTKDLLKAVTADAKWKLPQPFDPKTPTVAHELAKYLFIDLQNADPKEGTDELMRFFDDKVIYRDFNYPDVLRGPAQVRQFVENFKFPGIEFRPLRFDDGVDSTCFTWEVVLNDAPDTVKGISFYELDPTTRKITYVRDVPESAIKPPLLGKLARQFRPGLGVFQGLPLNSRPVGM
jgi:hypothetical protein